PPGELECEPAGWPASTSGRPRYDPKLTLRRGSVVRCKHDLETENPSPLSAFGAPGRVEVIGDEKAVESRYLNRELSWLDFNARVLHLAHRRSLPVLERTKFLAIFSGNLDEFFQVRVGGLKMQIEAGVAHEGVDESPKQRLRMISERVRVLIWQRDAIFQAHVRDLADVGIHLLAWEQLDEEDHAFLGQVYEERIEPVLTPLAVDPAHPFPYISNLSLNLAVVVRAPGELVR